MIDICIDHLASRWNRSVKSLRRDIRRSARAGADIILLTEVADGNRPSGLPREGYTVLQDRSPWMAGEVAALVRDDFAEVVDWKTVQIGPDLGPGHAVYAIIVVVKLRCGCNLLVADAHLPAGVEYAWASDRADAYRAAVKRYRRQVGKMRRKHNVAAECVWADWNLNLKLSWVRVWVRETWPRFRAIGKKKTPRRGTHFFRLIDFPITTGLVQRAFSVLRLTLGSDHRGARLRAKHRCPK